MAFHRWTSRTMGYAARIDRNRVRSLRSWEIHPARGCMFHTRITAYDHNSLESTLSRAAHIGCTDAFYNADKHDGTLPCPLHSSGGGNSHGENQPGDCD